MSILKEGQASLDHVTGFVSEEQIACDFGVVGRFHGAHTAGQYDKLARDCDVRHPGFDTGAFMVPRDKQRSELGTDAYHGGIVFPRAMPALTRANITRAFSALHAQPA